MVINNSNIGNVSIVNSKRMNKRGQQMTLGTIIAIVLGIAVLVFLIFGFSSGWGNMWDRITNFGGGKVNVNAVVQGCELACSSNSVYDYCTKKRELVLEDKNTTIGILKSGGDYTCDQMRNYATQLGMDSCDLDCGTTPASGTTPVATGITPAQYEEAKAICGGVAGYELMLTPADGKTYFCTENFTPVTYENKEYSCCKKF